MDGSRPQGMGRGGGALMGKVSLTGTDTGPLWEAIEAYVQSRLTGADERTPTAQKVSLENAIEDFVELAVEDYLDEDL